MSNEAWRNAKLSTEPAVFSVDRDSPPVADFRKLLEWAREEMRRPRQPDVEVISLAEWDRRVAESCGFLPKQCDCRSPFCRLRHHNEMLPEKPDV
jgi:hypothetical protein